MASIKLANSKYTSLPAPEDLDLENDSDNTLASESFLGKQQNFKRSTRHTRTSKLETALTWFRWGSIVAIQGIILLLLFWREREGGMSAGWSVDTTETGGDVNGVYVPSKFNPFMNRG